MHVTEGEGSLDVAAAPHWQSLHDGMNGEMLQTSREHWQQSRERMNGRSSRGCWNAWTAAAPEGMASLTHAE